MSASRRHGCYNDMLSAPAAFTLHHCSNGLVVRLLLLVCNVGAGRRRQTYDDTLH